MSHKKRPSTRHIKSLLAIKYGKRCLICGDNHKLQYHHIIKFSESGSTDVENGALLCSLCHTKLHKNAINEQTYNDLIRSLKKERCK